MLSFLFRSCGVLGWDLHTDEKRLVLAIAVERIPDESDENGENGGNEQQNEQKPEEETRQTVFM